MPIPILADRIPVGTNNRVRCKKTLSNADDKDNPIRITGHFNWFDVDGVNVKPGVTTLANVSAEFADRVVYIRASGSA